MVGKGAGGAVSGEGGGGGRGRGVGGAVPGRADRAFGSARQVKRETIHQHNVIAERFGTLGEVRSELRTGVPSNAHTSRRAWLDQAARARGATIFAPDERAPLHPIVINEGAASLLPGVDRQAALWTLDMDGHGAVLDARVERAPVRTRCHLSFPEPHYLIAP